MIPVKICGITNLEDARLAVNSGASALGFIFYDKSPRYILPETASQIAADLKGQVSFTGVFVDKTLDYVHAAKEEIGLNFIQLHGNESPEYCHEVQLPVIKVFRVDDDPIKYRNGTWSIQFAECVLSVADAKEPQASDYTPPDDIPDDISDASATAYRATVRDIENISGLESGGLADLQKDWDKNQPIRETEDEPDD